MRELEKPTIRRVRPPTETPPVNGVEMPYAERVLPLTTSPHAPRFTASATREIHVRKSTDLKSRQEWGIVILLLVVFLAYVWLQIPAVVTAWADLRAIVG